MLAFSNTNWWWNQNFQDFVSVGEMTFPEGIVLVRCRHWETGVLQWVQEAKEEGIIEGSNIFDRKLIYVTSLEGDRGKVKVQVPRFDKDNLPNLT